jgi:uncharacterized protein YjbI with pentapeptide repeats
LVGRVFERDGLGREDDELFEEGFSGFGDLGDLGRFDGVGGAVFDELACAETVLDGVGFAGTVFGDGAFGGAAFCVETFGAGAVFGAVVFAGVGFCGSGFESFDGVGFDGVGFDGVDFDGSVFEGINLDGATRSFFAGVVGAVVVGVGVEPFANCASCCARSFTLRNILV